VSPLRWSRNVTRQAEPHITSVPPAGIEPATPGLGNRCSSPLSYEGTSAEGYEGVQPRAGGAILEVPASTGCIDRHLCHTL
jgi:hypothetical protein